MRSPLRLAIQTIEEWLADGGPRLAAALAYYTAFAIAPLLLLLTTLAAPLYREAEIGVLEQVLNLIPGRGEEAVTTWLDALKANRNGSDLAVIIGSVALVFGAAGVFGALKDALNLVWDVAAREERFLIQFLRRRFVSITMVVGTLFLLLVSMVISTGLTYILDVLALAFPKAAMALATIHAGFALLFATAVFTLILKLVPDVKVRWMDACVGGAATGVLFCLGQLLLGWYLADEARLSIYGTFTSVIVFLLWVYYSAQILLLGAEFTQVYSRREQSAGN
jgi:membrane protein